MHWEYFGNVVFVKWKGSLPRAAAWFDFVCLFIDLDTMKIPFGVYRVRILKQINALWQQKWVSPVQKHGIPPPTLFTSKKTTSFTRTNIKSLRVSKLENHAILQIFFTLYEIKFVTNRTKHGKNSFICFMTALPEKIYYRCYMYYSNIQT